MPTFTPGQIQKLTQLGISIPNQSKPNTQVTISNQSIGQIPLQTTTSTPTNRLLPLLSISGLTIFSLGSLFLLKSKIDPPQLPPPSQPIIPTPTQIPKSIQHYLLASQQYFSQALQSQSQNDQNSELVKLLNQSILAATESIKSFPADYRGYYQRSRIYQSLADSQPQLLSQAIADLATASRLNPTSADLTRELAALYAKTGDAQNTLTYLRATVALEPTKAQNFYDLARLEQQTGLFPQALATYNQLLPLLTDPDQKSKIQAEKSTLEKLVSQSSGVRADPSIRPSPQITPSLQDNPPLLQTSLPTQGLIIAAPDSGKTITVRNQTDSNSLSGEGTIPSGQDQITIPNSLLKSTSQVYVTVTQGNTPGLLQVLSKSSDSFTIGFNSPTSESIEFRWWIIN